MMNIVFLLLNHLARVKHSKRTFSVGAKCRRSSKFFQLARPLVAVRVFFAIVHDKSAFLFQVNKYKRMQLIESHESVVMDKRNPVLFHSIGMRRVDHLIMAKMRSTV